MNYRNRTINTCFECGRAVFKSYAGHDDEGVSTGAKDCVRIDTGRYLCIWCKEIVNARKREAKVESKKRDKDHWSNIGDLDFGESAE